MLPALQPAVSTEEEDITSPEAKPATPDAKPSPYVPAPDTAAAADSTTACPPLGEITDLDELAALREAGHTIVPTEALLVLKWGGVLTDAGRESSAMFGRWFRSAMYPGEGTGLLRLHSTYRHDLKIYSSDEGRVQMTAASFVKGLLDLEGELTPILASLVRGGMDCCGSNWILAVGVWVLSRGCGIGCMLYAYRAPCWHSQRANLTY